MMRLIILVVCSVFSTSLFAAVVLNNESDKLSYTIGNDLGKNFKTQQVTVNPVALNQGLRDGLQGKSQLSDDEKRKVTTDYQQHVSNMIAKNMATEAEINAKAGKKFLAENAKKPGVKTTSSGLEYKVLVPGKGKQPTANSTVTVDYEGKLLDGSVFDSSYKRGEPVTFPLNRVIKGWTEGLQLMQPGATYELFIPANLAYGKMGIPGTIPPEATLIFKVELHSVH